MIEPCTWWKHIIIQYNNYGHQRTLCTHDTSECHPPQGATASRKICKIPAVSWREQVLHDSSFPIETTQEQGNTWVAIIVVQHEICIDMLDTFRYNVLLYIIEQQGCFAKQVLIPLIVVNSPLILLVLGGWVKSHHVVWSPQYGLQLYLKWR